MKVNKIIHTSTLLFLLLLVTGACRKNEPEPEPTVIGIIEVDLSADKNLIRKKEALIGNFVTDGLSDILRQKDYEFDFCLINSGAIRYDEQKRPSAIYPAGSITNENILEMFPFGDVPVIVSMSGNQLKEVLERGVAQLPLAKGPFLQLSEEIRITVDTLAAEQQLNTDGTAVISPGARITSIEINGLNYDPTGIYKVLVINFLADGEDGFVTFNSIPAGQKQYFSEYISAFMIEYVILNTPITAILDGRITFD